MTRFKSETPTDLHLDTTSNTYSVHDNAPVLGPHRVVTFGNVTVIGPELTPEQRARNSAESHAALMRLKECLAVPGVRIERKPGVPLVYANKHRPGTVIREIDGRKEVGLLRKDGSFEFIDSNDTV